ncbi:hypothetical protein OPQ81_010988 [Rhizoctonia solani]|nr:hypothetical protein OPQ81_010988 [Rhizoctonia solani]
MTAASSHHHSFHRSSAPHRTYFTMAKGYTYKSHGTNSKGNHYCSRDYGSSAPNQNSYHYSNTDGSYYYSNPDGSTYYNNGSGYANYTSPNGGGWSSSGGSRQSR